MGPRALAALAVVGVAVACLVGTPHFALRIVNLADLELQWPLRSCVCAAAAIEAAVAGACRLDGGDG
jgi:uncharacterized membrane protein AbrB (regulator of aidB expression)